MKWLRKYWSLLLNGLLVILVVILLIPEPEKVAEADLSNFTHNDLANSLKIEPGMTKQDMLSIMGTPAVKEISLSFEEFHYCDTGQQFDEFVSIKTIDDKVIAMSYSVAGLDDVAFYYVSEPPVEFLETLKAFDCKHSIMWRKHPRTVTHDKTFSN